MRWKEAATRAVIAATGDEDGGSGVEILRVVGGSEHDGGEDGLVWILG